MNLQARFQKPSVGTSEAQEINLRNIVFVSFALRAMLALALLYTLYLARDFLIPVSLAGLLYPALWPSVHWLRRVGIGPRLAAALLIGILLAILGTTSVTLIDPASRWLDRSAESLQILNRKLRTFRTPVEKVSRAAEEVADLTGLNPQSDARNEVQIRLPGISESLLEHAWTTFAEIWLPSTGSNGPFYVPGFTFSCPALRV